MSNKFDELTKSMAQSMTRKQALKKFGAGLAGMALACLGLPNEADASPKCSAHGDCPIDNPHCCNTKKCTTYTCPTDSYWPVDAQYCAFNCPGR